jgi:hypothetical protein
MQLRWLERLTTRSALKALPRVSEDNATCATSTCKICGGGAAAFDVVDFNKFCGAKRPYRFGLAGIPVHYERCFECGFIFTRFFDD